MDTGFTHHSVLNVLTLVIILVAWLFQDDGSIFRHPVCTRVRGMKENDHTTVLGLPFAQDTFWNCVVKKLHNNLLLVRRKGKGIMCKQLNVCHQWLIQSLAHKTWLIVWLDEVPEMGRDQVLWQLFNGFVWGMYDIKTVFFFFFYIRAYPFTCF